MSHPEVYGEQITEQSNDAPPQSSVNVDEPSNRDPSSSDRPLKQELEESATGKHEISETECERGSDGSDSRPNPTSPKRARMAENFDVKNVDSDSVTTHQEQESAESTKSSETGIPPGCSKREPCAHEDLKPHGPPNQVEIAQENPLSVLGPYISDNQDRLENVLIVGLEVHENPFVEPEAIELQVQEDQLENVPHVGLEAHEIPFVEAEVIELQVQEDQLENVPHIGLEAHEIPFVEAEAIELQVQEDQLENVPHDEIEANEIPFVEPEVIELQVQEVHEIIDNDVHQQYFPPSPMTMFDKDLMFTRDVYECPECEILFVYSSLYFFHMIGHRRNSPICGCCFVCVCESHYHNDKFGFNAHLLMATHDYHLVEVVELIQNTDGSPPIDDARKAFWRGLDVYWCVYCCILYKHQIMHRFHVRNHGVPHPHLYVCRQCQLIFQGRFDFNLHLFLEPHNDPYIDDINDALLQ